MKRIDLLALCLIFFGAIPTTKPAAAQQQADQGSEISVTEEFENKFSEATKPADKKKVLRETLRVAVADGNFELMGLVLSKEEEIDAAAPKDLDATWEKICEAYKDSVLGDKAVKKNTREYKAYAEKRRLERSQQFRAKKIETLQQKIKSLEELETQSKKRLSQKQKEFEKDLLNIRTERSQAEASRDSLQDRQKKVPFNTRIDQLKKNEAKISTAIENYKRRIAKPNATIQDKKNRINVLIQRQNAAIEENKEAIKKVTAVASGAEANLDAELDSVYDFFYDTYTMVYTQPGTELVNAKNGGNTVLHTLAQKADASAAHFDILSTLIDEYGANRTLENNDKTNKKTPIDFAAQTHKKTGRTMFADFIFCKLYHPQTKKLLNILTTALKYLGKNNNDKMLKETTDVITDIRNVLTHDLKYEGLANAPITRYQMSLYYLTKGLGRFQDVLSTLNPIEVAAAAPADNPEANPLGALKVPARDPNALVNAQ